MLLAVSAMAASAVNASELPKLERAKLEPAKRDPFTAFSPPPPKAAKVKLQPVAAMPAPAPMAAPLPSAPELGLQYAGQMTTPSGERLVFAAQQGEQGGRSGQGLLVTLKKGLLLDNGFVVQAIEPGAVRFHYPPTNTTARLNLPELPTFESR